MNRAARWKFTMALALLGVAAILGFRTLRGYRPGTERAYFYDLSEGRLFTAVRSAVPPIRGLNDAEEDGVRAVVVSVNGDPEDEKARRIAYLEKYSPQLKQQVMASRTGSASGTVDGQISRIAAQDHIFVRQLAGGDWFPVSSPEGEQIMTEWQIPGPDGRVPVVCVP
jgi:hypothetical protein